MFYIYTFIYRLVCNAFDLEDGKLVRLPNQAYAERARANTSTSGHLTSNDTKINDGTAPNGYMQNVIVIHGPERITIENKP